MTKEKLTLDSDDIDTLYALVDAHGPDGPHGEQRAEYRRIASEIEEQRGNYVGSTAIALCGLPGSGKSHVADLLAEVYDAPVVSMGDAIRENYTEQVFDGVAPAVGYSSRELGEFAAETREERAETIPEWTVDLAKAEQAEVVIIDGVRSRVDHEVLSESFENFYLIHVDAPFYIRLHRIKVRAREDEGTFTPVSLAERDERELYDLGFAELMAIVEPDARLDNDAGPNVLSVRLREIIHSDDIDVDIVDDSALARLDAKN